MVIAALTLLVSGSATAEPMGTDNIADGSTVIRHWGSNFKEKLSGDFSPDLGKEAIYLKNRYNVITADKMNVSIGSDLSQADKDLLLMLQENKAESVGQKQHQPSLMQDKESELKVNKISKQESAIQKQHQPSFYFKAANVYQSLTKFAASVWNTFKYFFPIA